MKKKIEKLLKKLSNCSIGEKKEFDKIAKLALELRKLKEKADYEDKDEEFWKICKGELKKEWYAAMEKMNVVIMSYSDLELLLGARRDYREINKKWGFDDD